MASTATPLPSLLGVPVGYRALVVGAQGGIGAALMAHLQADPRCAGVWGTARAPQAGSPHILHGPVR